MLRFRVGQVVLFMVEAIDSPNVIRVTIYQNIVGLITVFDIIIPLTPNDNPGRQLGLLGVFKLID